MTSARTRGRLIERLRNEGIKDETVLAAMNEIPRHIFIDEALGTRAYDDVSLPIGHGQTISQPYIVARMTEVLRNGKQLNRVLEIGTGCGYQSAILAALCERVYTVERIKPLLARARRTFDRLQLYNIMSKVADGTEGWPENAPFAAIIVTAAGPLIPQPLVDQLADPGVMVLPVGDREGQTLMLVRKEGGEVTITAVESVCFVKLVGTHGWKAA
ncbi:MAG TPA: protein-L-isoaspartate O-methyltransferase [Gallionellaceae bacterium]|nr:protein-L-isoaspartate O-methyltransferase [Gallionellaceae bacterium]